MLRKHQMAALPVLLALCLPAPALATPQGHIARADLRRRPDLDGDGMALTGLILGYAALVLSLLALLLLALFFGGVLAFAAAA